MKAPIKIDKLSEHGLQVANVWKPRNPGRGMGWDVLLTDGNYYDFHPMAQPRLTGTQRALGLGRIGSAARSFVEYQP